MLAKRYNIVQESPLAEYDVSVITPTKSAQNLSKTLASVLKQKDLNLELILVDDCSAAPASIPYSDTTIIRMVRHCGAAACRNVGIEFAKSQWVAFLDDDDNWQYDRLSDVLKYAELRGGSWVYTDYLAAHPQRFGPLRLVKRGSSISDINTLLTHCDIGMSTVVIKREIMASERFNEDFVRRSDYEMWLRLMSKGLFPLHMPDNMSVIVSKEGGRLSSHKLLLLGWQFMAIKKGANVNTARALFFLLHHVKNGIVDVVTRFFGKFER